MIKRSTINFWKMQGEGAWGLQIVLNMIHGYMYYTLYDYYITSHRIVVGDRCAASLIFDQAQPN